MPDIQPLYPDYCFFLHQLTFDAIASQTKPVVGIDGIMYGGKERRGANAPNKNDLWLAWQKEVANVARRRYEKDYYLTQEVMAYFQATKSLTKAPTEPVTLDPLVMANRADLYEPHPIYREQFHPQPIAEEPMPPKRPRFTWSYTALSDFESCPLSFAHKRYYKTIKFQETEATIWGNRVHKAAEVYFKTGQVTDHEAYAIVKAYCEPIKGAPGETHAEMQMALTAGMKPCSFRDWDNAWGRGIIDVVKVHNEKALIYDFKTGKVKDDPTQLKIFCAFLALHRPDIHTFDAKFIWVKEGKVAGLERPLMRTEIVGVWQEILPRITRMKQAWDAEVFPARTSGLCKKHCDVMDCPHNGRR